MENNIIQGPWKPLPPPSEIREDAEPAKNVLPYSPFEPLIQQALAIFGAETNGRKPNADLENSTH